MIELHCPQCRAKLRLLNQTPAQGAVGLVKCPLCGEIFQGRQVDFQTKEWERSRTQFQDPVSDWRPNPSSSLQARWEPPQIKTERKSERKNEDLDLFDCRPVTPSRTGSKAIGVFILLILALASVVGINLMADDPKEPSRQLPPARARDYASNYLAGDLLALRHDLGRMGRADKRIDYHGYESRIYRYLTEQLGGELDVDLIELDIHAEDTSYGLIMRGIFAESSRLAPELIITWEKDKAKAQLTNEEPILEVNLSV
ncbi:MAG: zinc-ribbon domain-containing protein [Deltaproteobacteria bacterium]|jgi:hypothetical protein|nr:zinc-ribbon domain-containing protein [Deltaproteobacteria bacterium]